MDRAHRLCGVHGGSLHQAGRPLRREEGLVRIRRRTMNPGSKKKTLDTLLKIILAVFVFTLPLWLTSPTYLQILIFLFLFAYLTTTWNLVGGFAGVLPLGHSAYVGIGAYTSTVLYITWGISPWVGMWV